MKLKSSIKWAIAAAATMTTVAVSVSIANAYTYNWDATSGGGYGIFGDGNDKTEKEYYRNGYDFEFSEENFALTQAVRFELSVDIKDFYSNRIYQDIPTGATINFGGYGKGGNRIDFDSFVIDAAYSGDLEYTFTDADKDSMARGKFWMELEESSYSSVEFKSIKFYDKDDHCILYGCAQDMGMNEENYYGQWTFYQLDAPALEVEGIQNADGRYALNATVSVSEPTMAVKTSNGANENICVSASAKRFLNGEEITDAKSFAYNSAEGANNKYSFVTNACVVLKDSRNKTEITLYSVGAEKTVTIGKLKIKAGEPQLLGVLPTISYGEFASTDELLLWLNGATRDPDFTAPQVDGAYVDSSVKDDTALFGRALITGADGSSKVIAKVVYDEVSGFDPASHKAQTITLKAHVVANDIEFLSDSANFRDGTVFFEEQINCSADYIDSVKISKLPRTDYEYREGLDLSGGELTIAYNSDPNNYNSAPETVPMTDARFSVSGFYGANGEFPAYNSEVKVTVTYTAEDGVYDPERADGAKFSDTFTVTVKDLPKLDAPVITPNGGKFSKSVEVSITAADGAAIYYTTDGTDPTANSIKYTAPFTITSNATVKAIAVMEGCNDSKIATAEFTRRSTKPSGGNSRPYSDSGKTTGNSMTINGEPMSWDDVVNYLNRLSDNSSLKIYLNGNTAVPVEVISAIKDKALTVELVYDSVKSWVVRGSNVGAASAAEFSMSSGNADRNMLRGVFGVDIVVSGTNVRSELRLYFRDTFAGQFANVYKVNGGVLQFLGCAMIDKDGAANISGADAAGEYVVMVCEFSDVTGDADNDGILSALDASAILRHITDMASPANIDMCDFDGDGEVNALDAAAVLKKIVGIR